MLRAVADTHTIIWYLYDDARLSSTARTWIEDAAAADEQIVISTITLAEMVYLIEKGRIDATALTRLMTNLDAVDAVGGDPLRSARSPGYDPRDTNRSARSARSHHRRNGPPPGPAHYQPRSQDSGRRAERCLVTVRYSNERFPPNDDGAAHYCGCSHTGHCQLRHEHGADYAQGER